MKSAYELAMERLEASDPQQSLKLSDADKVALHNIDAKYQAKIAEREIFLNKQLLEAKRQRDRDAMQQIESQLRNERLRLNEEKEAEKEKVRHNAQS